MNQRDKELLSRVLASALQNEFGVIDAYSGCHDDDARKVRRNTQRFIGKIKAFAARNGIQIARLYPADLKPVTLQELRERTPPPR